LSPKAKSKLVQKLKDDNAKKKAAGASGDAKKSSASKDDDDSSVASSKSVVELQNENARLKQRLKKTNACLVTTINEGDEDDDNLTDDEGSMSFVAAASFMAEMCPKLLKGVLLAMRTSMDLRSQVLLDSQSTHDVFCNPKYVSNIRKAKRDLVLSTNGGGMKISQEADVSGLYPVGHNSTVYFDPRAITNIVSLKRICALFCVTYDSEESNTFVVHRSSHGLPDLKFVMHECGLHLRVGPIKGNMFVQMVEENKKPYTKAQVARDTEARKYYDALLCHTSKDFSNILNLGGIRGCDLTKENADISFKIFGPSVTKGKGNATRQAAKLSPSSIVSVPREVI